MTLGLSVVAFIVILCFVAGFLFASRAAKTRAGVFFSRNSLRFYFPRRAERDGRGRVHCAVYGGQVSAADGILLLLRR